MVNTIRKLNEELEVALGSLSSQESFIRYTEMATNQVSLMLERVNHVLQNTATNTKDDLIELHKHLMPEIYSKYIYYACLHNIEYNKPIGSGQREYFVKRFEKTEVFFRKNASFIKYCRSGKTHLDQSYFLPGSIQPGLFIDISAPLDQALSRLPYSFLYGKALAYKRLQSYLLENIEQNNITATRPSLQWTASKTGLIELAYSLHAAGVFNNGNTTVKQITSFIEATLGIRLGNTSLRFQEILRRKETAAFILELKQQLELYVLRIEEKKFR